MGRLVIVSNRLPVTVHPGEGGAEPRVARSPGGLATGLAGPHESSEGLWVGWPGDLSALTPEQRERVEAELEAQRLVPVDLTAEEVSGYYEGFSNRVLWPLFHYLLDHIPLEAMQWEIYRRVNARFADAVAERASPDDTIWVQDYQLCLVPALLRERLPGARIGFFLHIPFPTSEVLQALPWRDELLRGLLGADLVGFHTSLYARQCGMALRRLLGLHADGDRVLYQGRSVRLGAYPMGIDAEGFARAAERDEVVARAQELRREAGGARLLFGIDRLDYTKGIRRRLLALDRLLERAPELRGQVTLVQIAVPSRTSIAEYDEFRQDVDEVVGRLNGAHGTTSWSPVRYLYRAFSREDLAAFYRAADVMLVTPLRDGMNLVAKEFVASRVDERGVLLLSELAGAAAELGAGAVLVNPYDVDGTSDAILRALVMPEEEQRERMRAMRERVFRWDVHHWVRAFLQDLEGPQAPPLAITPEGVLRPLRERLAMAAGRVLLLDCDGTLLEHRLEPGQVTPDAELIALLLRLAGLPRTDVHLVSGRPAAVLEAWFGRLPVGLHAEHGLWWRPIWRGGQPGPWRTDRPVSAAWKARVRPLLEALSLRTPGAFVEEKPTTLAWHYRRTEPELGEARAAELLRRLEEALRDEDAEVLAGDRVVEIRPRGATKAAVVARALEAAAPGAVAVAMGDDRTDEDLFGALPPSGVALHVGARESAAPYRLPSAAAARRFLRALADEVERLDQVAATDPWSSASPRSP
jgi:trehalose 6-phosphate synthase/phosphatase